MSDPRIRQAFETRLATWAAAQSPALPVVYENDLNDPKEGAYVRAWLIQAPDGSRGLDGKHREYSGIFQVDLCIPIDTGVGTATALAQSLDNEFDTDAPITQGGLSIWITSPMTEARPIPGEKHYITPVSCRYQSHLFKS